MNSSSFSFGYKLNNVLFFGFNISSVLGLLATCFVLLGFAFLFEFIKMVQAKVRQKRLLLKQQQLRSICPSESDSLLTQAGTSTQKPPPRPLTKKDRIFQAVNDLALWLSQQLIGYGLMLMVMLYNGYFIISVVIGAALGYFLFGPTFMKINMENCKAMRETFCTANCVEPDKAALLGSNNGTTQSGAPQSSPACHTSNIPEKGNLQTVPSIS